MGYSVIMPTINGAPESLARACFESIEANASDDAQLIVCAPDAPQSCSGRWQFIAMKRHANAYVDCYRRCLGMLQIADNETVFIVEHDVLYAPGYFDPDAQRVGYYMYNTNVKTLTPGGFIIHKRPKRIVTSQIVAQRELLAEHFRRAISWIGSNCRILWDEPGLKWNDQGVAFPTVAPLAEYESPAPSIDIRWGGNLTGDRQAATYEQECNTWGNASELRKELGI